MIRRDEAFAKSAVELRITTGSLLSTEVSRSLLLIINAFAQIRCLAFSLLESDSDVTVLRWSTYRRKFSGNAGLPSEHGRASSFDEPQLDVLAAAPKPLEMSFFRRFRLPQTRRLYPDGSYKRTAFGLCVLYANIAFFGHVFTTYWYSVTIPWGASMLPTIYFTNEALIISKRYRRGRNIEVGDIVSFRNPVKPWEGAIKRVVGMPGDFVLRDSPESGSDMMIQVCGLAPDGSEWCLAACNC